MTDPDRTFLPLPTNPPLLTDLAYRLGDRETFLAALFDRMATPISIVGSSSVPTVNTILRDRLLTRERSDVAVALLDAWATIADGVSFYQERIFQEAFLRTAKERRSLQELAKLVGYRPRPGLSASAEVAFIVEPPPPAGLIPSPAADGIPARSTSQTQEIVIPKGVQVKSIPAPGTQDKPQTFETSDPVIARPEWSDIRPRLTRPQAITDLTIHDLTELYLDGLGLRLAKGDYLLIVPTPASVGAVVRILEVIEEKPLSKTKVVLKRKLYDPQAMVDEFVVAFRSFTYPHTIAVSPTPIDVVEVTQIQAALIKGYQDLPPGKLDLRSLKSTYLHLARFICEIKNTIVTNTLYIGLNADKAPHTAVAAIAAKLIFSSGTGISFTTPFVDSIKAAVKEYDEDAALVNLTIVDFATPLHSASFAKLKKAVYGVAFKNVSQPTEVVASVRQNESTKPFENAFAGLAGNPTLSYVLTLTSLTGDVAWKMPVVGLPPFSTLDDTTTITGSFLSVFSVAQQLETFDPTAKSHIFRTELKVGTESRDRGLVFAETSNDRLLPRQKMLVIANESDQNSALLGLNATLLPTFSYELFVRGIDANLNLLLPMGGAIDSSGQVSITTAGMPETSLTNDQVRELLQQATVALQGNPGHSRKQLTVEINSPAGVCVAAAAVEVLIVNNTTSQIFYHPKSPQLLMVDLYNSVVASFDAATPDPLAVVNSSLPPSTDPTEATLQAIRDLVSTVGLEPALNAVLATVASIDPAPTTEPPLWKNRLSRLAWRVFVSAQAMNTMIDTECEAIALAIAPANFVSDTAKKVLSGVTLPTSQPLEAIDQLAILTSLDGWKTSLTDIATKSRMVEANSKLYVDFVSDLETALTSQLPQNLGDVLKARCIEVAADVTRRIEAARATLQDDELIEADKLKLAVVAESLRLVSNICGGLEGSFPLPQMIAKLKKAAASAFPTTKALANSLRSLALVLDPKLENPSAALSNNSIDRSLQLLLQMQKQGNDRERAGLLQELSADAGLLLEFIGRLQEADRELLFEQLRGFRVENSEKHPRVYAFRSRANIFGWNAPSDASTIANKINVALSGNAITLDIIKEAVGEVFAPTISSPTTILGGLGWLRLEGEYPKTIAGTYILLDFEPESATATIQPPTAHKVVEMKIGPTVGYNLKGSVTKIAMDPSALAKIEVSLDNAPSNTLRTTKVYCDAEELILAEAPEPPALSPTNQIECDTFVAGLAAGRVVLVEGIPSAAGTASPAGASLASAERFTVINVSHRVVPHPVLGQAIDSTTMGVGTDSSATVENGQVFGDRVVTVILLDRPLRQELKRETVRVYGNVVRVTHGETRSEPLGGGDGKAFQQFALRSFPLTFVSAKSESGLAAELDVRVNDVLWREVVTHRDASENGQAYELQNGPAGKGAIRFGERVRPPTGVENITAKYRVGLGVAGNVAANRISQVIGAPVGVKSGVNPLGASGGADPDRADAIRERIPAAVAGVDRLVSTRDYADFTRAFAGIGKADAVLLDGKVRITASLTTPDPIDRESPLWLRLQEALAQFADPRQRFELLARSLSLMVVHVQVKLREEYDWRLVEPKLRSAMLDRFCYRRAEFGKDVLLSDVVATLLKSPAIWDVRVLKFAAMVTDVANSSVDNSGVKQLQDLLVPPPKPVIPVASTRRSKSGVLPAELCFLSPDVSNALVLEQMP